MLSLHAAIHNGEVGKWLSGHYCKQGNILERLSLWCSQDFAKAAMEPVLALAQEFLINSSLIRHISTVSGAWELCFWSKRRVRGQAKEQGQWRIGIEAYECRNEDTEEKVIAHTARLT